MRKKSRKSSFIKTMWVITAILSLFFVIIAATMLIPKEDKKTPVFMHKINQKYPHDQSAFTQGLIYQDGYFYESTGLYGQSEIRRVDSRSGKVLDSHKLDNHLFGEGITLLDDKLYQLTWKSGIVFVYDIDNLELIDSFFISGEGWGLTNDGNHLIQSDGSDSLYFLDPETLNLLFQISVFDDNGPVENINELQYINGLVYANIWKEYKIAVIDPSEGEVQFWIDCTGIIDRTEYPDIDVMNGIAYDKEQDRLFVTGKYWPFIYDISVISPNK